MIDERILICALFSALLHFGLSRGLDSLPAHDTRAPRQIDVRLVEPEPPPEPEKPPEKPPEEKPEVHEAPKPRAIKQQQQAEKPKDTPPPTNETLTSDTSDTPFFGGNIESTSPVGTGPAIPIGNTTRAVDTGSGSAATKPLATPVAAFETTKMPVMNERCRFGLGKYTDEALQAGVEGQVVIDLIVAEDGSVREVQVVKSLPHGLTEEAVRALRACKFTPGEKDGHAVPVRIRGFKVTFVLPQG